MPAIQHETIGANGLRFHVARSHAVRVARSGDGPLMLFLHGFPDFWYCWREQLAYFGARGWNAAAPDLRGFNESDKPEGVDQYRAKHIMADMAALAARYTQEKFVLVAHDWGGAVAWGMAIARPELLSHLVIINSPHPYLFWRELCNNPAQQQASDYMLLFRSPKAERVLSEDGFERLWRMVSTEWGGGNDEDKEAYIRAWSQPGALTGGLNYYRAAPMYPPKPEDPGPRKLSLAAKDFVVRVPTLVIWGEKDRALLPSLLDGLDECVPGMKLVRVPEAGHWVMRQRPDLVNREIEAFVSGRGD
jgi:pimeloyl-ACP methyl ester carboxylesterase